MASMTVIASPDPYRSEVDSWLSNSPKGVNQVSRSQEERPSTRTLKEQCFKAPKLSKP